jgi:hypothetical protein
LGLGFTAPGAVANVTPVWGALRLPFPAAF